MPKRSIRLIFAVLITSTAVCLAVEVTPKMPTIVARLGPAVPQELASLHLTLGNPSGTTTSTLNKNNYLLVKSQFAAGHE